MTGVRLLYAQDDGTFILTRAELERLLNEIKDEGRAFNTLPFSPQFYNSTITSKVYYTDEDSIGRIVLKGD